MTLDPDTNAQEVNEIEVHLTLTGDQDPSKLTAAIGVEPTRTWRRGDLIGRSSRRYEFDGWRLSAPGRYEDVESGVDAVLQIAGPGWAALCEISGQLDVEMSVVVYANSSVPAIHIRRDQLRMLDKLGADIDVDLYCLANASE